MGTPLSTGKLASFEHLPTEALTKTQEILYKYLQVVPFKLGWQVVGFETIRCLNLLKLRPLGGVLHLLGSTEDVFVLRWVRIHGATVLGHGSFLEMLGGKRIREFVK